MRFSVLRSLQGSRAAQEGLAKRRALKTFPKHYIPRPSEELYLK